MGPAAWIKTPGNAERMPPLPLYHSLRDRSQSVAGSMPRKLLHVLLIALTLPALLLSLSSGPTDELEVSDPGPMVVKFACLACEERNGTPNFFTTYRGACSHKSHSPFCNMSSKGIATVVLPNRPTDNEAGGSGAAGQWSGQQQQRNSGVRALPPGQQRQGMRY